MKIMNRLGYGLHRLGTNAATYTVAGLKAIGNDVKVGCKEFATGLKGTKLDDKQPTVQMATPRKQRA